MNAVSRLGAYGVVLALAFGVGSVLGAAIGPVNTAADAAAGGATRHDDANSTGHLTTPGPTDKHE